MKLLLENWRKYLKEEKRIINSREEMEFIITQDPDQVINIDVEFGQPKAFGDEENPKPLPFNYGEYIHFINPADNMGWDLVVSPSSPPEHKNLLPVGNISYVKDREDKTGNDKIIVAADGKFDNADKETIDDFFDKLPQFNRVEWYSNPMVPKKES